MCLLYWQTWVLMQMLFVRLVFVSFVPWFSFHTPQPACMLYFIFGQQHTYVFWSLHWTYFYRSLLLEKKYLEDVDIRVICIQILQLFTSVQGVLKEERVPSPKSLSWLCPMMVKSHFILRFSSFWLNETHNISCCITQTSLTLLRILLVTLPRVRYTLTGSFTTDRCDMLHSFFISVVTFSNKHKKVSHASTMISVSFCCSSLKQIYPPINVLPSLSRLMKVAKPFHYITLLKFTMNLLT